MTDARSPSSLLLFEDSAPLETATNLNSRVSKAARISGCGTFRYWLTRFWDEGDSLVFVMLNPSTADASLDDPTIRRCIGFAGREGFAGASVVNLYAYRATNPKALLTCADAVGPENDDYLRLILSEQTRRGNPVVAAWGANARPDRVSQVLNLVPGVDWRCLGTTKAGHPKHPLYIKGDQPLLPFGKAS
jgi:hypothetical protein